MKVVWHNDKLLIMQTAESDGIFVVDNLFQIYKRIGKTDKWLRQPDYRKVRKIVWYKTLEAAKEAILDSKQRP